MKKKPILIITIILSVNSLLSIIFPKLLGNIIDNVTADKPYLQDVRIYIYILFLYHAIIIFGTLLYIYLYTRCVKDIKQHNLLQLYSVNNKYIQHKGAGYFSNLIGTIAAQSLIPYTVEFATFFINVLQSLVILFVVFYLNTTIGIVFSYFGIIIIIKIFLQNRIASKTYSTQLASINKSNSFITNYINILPLIKSYDTLKTLFDNKAKHVFHKESKHRFHYLFSSEVLEVFLAFLKDIGKIYLLYVLIVQYKDGAILVGSIFVFLAYFSTFVSLDFALSYFNEFLFQTKISHTQLKEFYEKNENIKNIYTEKKDFLLKLKNVELQYDNHVIYHNVNVTLEYDKIGLISYSGKGKSSLLHLITKRTESQEGDMYVLNDENNIKNIIVEKVFSYLGQDIEIFHGTFIENITCGTPYESDEEIKKIIVLLGLETLHSKILLEGGQNLSGGEKQKLMFARFLYHLKNKEFFILDEPFTSLDYDIKNNYIHILKEYIHTMPGILITHDFDILSALNIDIYYAIEDSSIKKIDITQHNLYKKYKDTKL